MKLIDYIQGKRRGQEANKLEREAMNDPFLQDAIDGFDAVQDDHIQAIRDLENKIIDKTTKRKPLISYRTWAIGAAASVILILGIGNILHVGMQKLENTAVIAPKHVILPQKDTIKNIEPVKTAKKLVAQQLKKRKQHATSIKNEFQPTNSEEVLIKTQDQLNENKNVISVADVAEAMSFRQRDSNTNMSANSKMDIADVKAAPQFILGKVTDEKGEPLIGATVRFKSLNSGTTTKQDGTFDLPIPNKKSDKILVSYIGYEKEEVPVSGNSYIVKLKPNPSIGEVVVVGHPSERKMSVVGAIASTKAEAIEFNENEFIKYYKTYHKTDLCNAQKYILKAKFHLDEYGNPVKIKVTKSPCEEIKQEFIQLLNANKWTKGNRNVSLKIEM
jgi:hypothetical protein